MKRKELKFQKQKMRKLVVTIQSLIITQKRKKKKINYADEAKKEDSKKIYVVHNGPKLRIYTSARSK
ncbi:MAG: hypothetical protein K6253_02390 [Candidatus Liberibacter asiaticus]|nr:hypothetical protein [Candidatus Liberibacter asiaticus]